MLAFCHAYITNFVHVGMDRSCALRRLSLKISHLLTNPLCTLQQFLIGSYQVPEVAKICSFEVRACNSAAHLAYFSLDTMV